MLESLPTARMAFPRWSRDHSCWVLRREIQGRSIGTTVASTGFSYRSSRWVSDNEHWRSKEEQYEAQMGPIMSGCGALLGAHIRNGSSGSAPSWSPWRFSICTRTFAEVPWRREVLCAGASSAIARSSEELRTRPQDAVERHSGVLRCGMHQPSEPDQKVVRQRADNRGCRTKALRIGAQSRNGGGHGNNRWRKDQISLGSGPGGHHRRPHIRPRECGYAGSECGRDIGCGGDRNGYTR